MNDSRKKFEAWYSSTNVFKQSQMKYKEILLAAYEQGRADLAAELSKQEPAQ